MTQTRALGPQDDGSFWAGGSGGLAHLLPLAGGGAQLLASYRGKVDVFLDGLLTGNVLDLAADRNGDIWVALDAGLNRIRRSGDATVVDAWTNLENYTAYGLGSLYSPDIIAGLPGGAVLELAAEAGSGRLLAGGEFGAMLIDVAARGGGGRGLDAVYLYPNPFAGGSGDAGLKLGGLSGGGARVEIYDLQGQLVFRISDVAAGETIWDGRSQWSLSASEFVSTGLYTVKVTQDGSTAIRTLAVVR